MSARKWSLAVTVNLDETHLHDAIVAADDDTALETILALDLAIGDVGFTEKLVKRLVASLRGDMDDAAFGGLIAALAMLPATLAGKDGAK